MNLSDQFVYFLDDDKFRDTDRPGFRRRVVTGENMQLCFWRIAGGPREASSTVIRRTSSLGSSPAGGSIFVSAKTRMSKRVSSWVRVRSTSRARGSGTVIRSSLAMTNTASVGFSTSSHRRVTT